MRMLHGRYIGPLWSAPSGGDGGGGGGGSGDGAPPSLPPPPAPANPPAPAPASPPANQGQGQPPKAPRKRAAPKSGTSVKAGSGGVTVSHKDQQGNRVSGKVTGPGDVLEGISELPAPGGLVLMLAILLLLLFAIVPVTPKGKTRLALLWDTLRGKTQIPAPPASASSSSSSSAAQQSSQNWLQDLEGAALGVAGGLIPSGGNAGGAGMVPADALASNGYHRVQDAPVPESVAAAPADGYGYVDAWQGPTTPQPYYGETEYDAPVFPELE